MDLVVKYRDRDVKVRVDRDAHLYRVEIDGRLYEVDAVSTDGSVSSLLVGGRQNVVSARRRGGGRYTVRHSGREDELELLDPLTHLAKKTHALAAGSSHRVDAYMPGRVVQVLVEEGEEVEAGQGLVVLEAMKMENEIQAEHAGTVERILVEPGQAVEGGDPLFEIT